MKYLTDMSTAELIQTLTAAHDGTNPTLVPEVAYFSIAREALRRLATSDVKQNAVGAPRAIAEIIRLATTAAPMLTDTYGTHGKCMQLWEEGR